MRKTIACIGAAILAVALGSAALAQETFDRHEVNVSIGGSPWSFAIEPETYFPGYETWSTVKLSDVYEDQFVDMSYMPVITAEYGYRLRRWLQVGLQVDWCAGYATRYKPSSGASLGERRVSEVQLLPFVKLFAVNNPHFKLYGGGGAGLRTGFGSDCGDGYFKAAPSFEIVPLGLQWGGELIFAFAEIGLGTVICGGRVGMGVRF